MSATTVITSAEIYSKIDPNHAVAVVTRVGGGWYRLRTIDGFKIRPDGADVEYDSFPTYGEAITAAEKYATVLASPSNAAKAAQVQIAAHAAEIARLKAQLAEQ